MKNSNKAIVPLPMDQLGAPRMSAINRTVLQIVASSPAGLTTDEVLLRVHKSTGTRSGKNTMYNLVFRGWLRNLTADRKPALWVVGRKLAEQIKSLAPDASQPAPEPEPVPVPEPANGKTPPRRISFLGTVYVPKPWQPARAESTQADLVPSLVDGKQVPYTGIKSQCSGSGRMVFGPSRINGNRAGAQS